MKHISLLLIRAALLLPSIAAVHAQTIDSGVVDNRPFDARPFARIAGPRPAAPVAPTPADPPSVGLQIDWTTKETNELIVSLRSDVNGTLNALVAKTGPAGQAPGQVEDGAIAAINRQHGAVTIPFGLVKHARRLMPGPRMSDNERATLARINPQAEALESFVVLRYGSILEAQLAVQTLKSQLIAKTAGINFVNDDPVSWAPNDPYFSAAAPVAGSNAAANKKQYQWGLYAMNFPAAWDMVRGTAYIGVYEPSWPGTTQLVNGIQTINVHPDLVSNFRTQFSPGAPFPSTMGLDINAPHSTHVSGIIAAQTNNGEYNTSGATPTTPKGGVAGGCPTCSIATFAYADNALFNPTGGGSATAAVQGPALKAASDGGMQVINWSGSLPQTATGLTCSMFGDYTGGNDSFAPMCSVLGLIKQRDVLLVEAVGNFNSQTLLEPLNMADRFPILPVGGVQPLNESNGNDTAVTRWYYGPYTWLGVTTDNGSNYASMNGVVAPAKSIISTITAGSAFNWLPYALCGDGYDPYGYGMLADESPGRYANGLGDGYGSCTGTSMAAPHVTALAGLMRSLNPVVSAEGVRATIQRYSSMWIGKTAEYGSGLPDAQMAVDYIRQSNSGPLIPLYSFYSADRSDSFYTTSPQMASAALAGTLYPARPELPENKRYGSSYGGLLWSSNPYYGNTYPGVSGISTPLPTERRAEVFVFNTHRYALNGTDWVDLSPLYRLSWVCGDSTPYYPTAVCQAHPAHNDVTYALEAELSYFKWLGYKVDGIEGYVYPKTLPQPVGSTYLLRMYNPQRDDHAIFPYSQYAAMWAAGYTSMTNGVNFLGWVYENIYGTAPGVQ